MSHNQSFKSERLATQGTPSHSWEAPPRRPEKTAVLVRQERQSQAIAPWNTQSDPPYIGDDHERSERTGSSRTSNGRHHHSGRSRHRHSSARTTPSEPVDEVHDTSDRSNIIRAEYSNITTYGSGFKMYGSVGEQARSSKYTELHSNTNGPMLYGGIQNATPDDVEALKVFQTAAHQAQPTRRHSRQHSGKERTQSKDSCCFA